MMLVRLITNICSPVVGTFRKFCCDLNIFNLHPVKCYPPNNGLWKKLSHPKSKHYWIKQKATSHTISACLRSFLANSSITALANAFRFFANACLTPSVDIQYGPITMLDGKEFSSVSLSFKCRSISCFTSEAERSCESYSLQKSFRRLKCLKY